MDWINKKTLYTSSNKTWTTFLSMYLCLVQQLYCSLHSVMLHKIRLRNRGGASVTLGLSGVEQGQHFRLSIYTYTTGRNCTVEILNRKIPVVRKSVGCRRSQEDLFCLQIQWIKSIESAREIEWNSTDVRVVPMQSDLVLPAGELWLWDHHYFPSTANTRMGPNHGTVYW
jgi:hypothetical protein